MKQQSILPVKTYRAMLLAIAVVALAVPAATPLHAQTYSALYEFGGKTGDPTNPQYTGLITQGRDGNLYTTAPSTPVGGLCSFCGAAFNVTPSGTVTVEY